jgi:hypothetical protein
MYYIFDYVNLDFQNLFIAHIDVKNPWYNFVHTYFNKPVGVPEETPKPPLKIITGRHNKKLNFYDYIFVPYLGYKLFSNKLVNLLLKFNINKIQFYETLINYRGAKKEINGYYFVNFYNYISALDIKNSIFTVNRLGGLYNFKKIVLNEKMIPNEVKMFIPEKTHIIIAHEDIKNDCENEEITGIKFIPIE